MTPEEVQEIASGMEADKWTAFKTHMQGLPDDAAREEYLRDFAQDNAARGDDASADMSRADMMRVDPMSIGPVGGRQQMAASPLAHLGAAAMNYQSGKNYQDAKGERTAARGADTDQRIAQARAMMGGGPPQGGQPQGGPPQGGPPPQAGPRPPSMGGPGQGAAGGMQNPGGMDLQQMLAAMRSR